MKLRWPVERKHRGGVGEAERGFVVVCAGAVAGLGLGAGRWVKAGDFVLSSGRADAHSVAAVERLFSRCVKSAD